MRVRISKVETIAAAMRVWEQGIIEVALGDDTACIRAAGGDPARSWRRCRGWR
jgi:hypothetical protein